MTDKIFEPKDSLEFEIFHILTDYEFKTLGEQREFCYRVAALFPQRNLAKYALKAIVEQLESCGYECEGGPLELNTAFIALKELAE